MFASVRKPAGEVIAEAFAEADRRDCDHLRPWFAVVDGNNHQIETITTLAADYQVKVPDPDRLHPRDCTTCGRPRQLLLPGRPPAGAWVKDQAAKILAGRHRDVARRDPPPRHHLRLQPRRARRRRRLRPLPEQQAGLPGLRPPP